MWIRKTGMSYLYMLLDNLFHLHDRCAQLNWSNDLSNDFKNPAAWAEVISKLKEGIIVAFDSAVTLREEEVRRSESQKTMPGWNFCTFFVLKVSS